MRNSIILVRKPKLPGTTMGDMVVGDIGIINDPELDDSLNGSACFFTITNMGERKIVMLNDVLSGDYYEISSAFKVDIVPDNATLTITIGEKI